MAHVRSLNHRRLYQLRLARGLSQEDVAHALRGRGHKTAAKSISRWENGSHAPRTEVLPDLAATLGASMEELYAADDDEEDSDSMSDLDRELLRVLRKWREGVPA